MNAVVLTSVLSAGNSGMYASTRMLYTLACQRMAPRMFSYVNKRGVPTMALLATTVVAALCFLTNIFSPQLVYIWRSEEHTSELQSHSDLVCRLLLEKKTVTQACRKLAADLPL